jgi:hypothetical protein
MKGVPKKIRGSIFFLFITIEITNLITLLTYLIQYHIRINRCFHRDMQLKNIVNFDFKETFRE